MTRSGAAGAHRRSSCSKRCGHRPNKEIVSCEEMEDRIKAAVDAKLDSNFILMARTDACRERIARGYRPSRKVSGSGADAIFAEAMTELSMYEKVVRSVDVPVLANITEFGATPLYTLEELRSVGIAMALYPLSAFRAMNQAALDVIAHCGARALRQL